MAAIRTHVLLPESLLKAIDSLVGQRKRSRFIAEAVAEKLERTRMAQAFEAAAGSLSEVEVEGWESGEEARDWVAELRSHDALRGLDEAAPVRAYLLDTSVLIDISKGRTAVVGQVRDLIAQGARLGICGVNVAEFYAGIEPKRSPEMDRFIASLGYWPLSLPAAMQAGAYRRAYRRGGTQRSTSDTLIAAVAREQGAAVLTGNVKHFPMDDLEVVSAGE